MSRYIDAYEYKERISRYPKNIRDIAIKELRYTKTADVRENVHGEWIRHDEIKNVYGGICIECPKCGEKYVVQHMEDEKFCRNCGADMIHNN